MWKRAQALSSLLGIDRAMRSASAMTGAARPGSVAASARAMSASALTLGASWVMDSAICFASISRRVVRARSKDGGNRRDAGARRSGEHPLDQVKKPVHIVLVPAITQL